MSRKKTHEEYVAELAIKNPNIDVVERYMTAHTKIRHKCKMDGYEWLITPSDVLSGKGCPQCKNKLTSERCKKTHVEYVKDVAIKNPYVEVLGTYTNSKTAILHKCLIDGHEWMCRPENILSGRGCPICANQNRSRNNSITHEEYVHRLAEENPNIEVIEQYVNARTAIAHKCLIDGYVWNNSPGHILNGQGCPKCGGSIKKTHEDYVCEVALINRNIEVVGQYINAHEPILHKCKIDGCIWAVRPNDILCGKGCPKCKESNGEKTVRLWLENHKVHYISQKWFNNCKDIKPLPYDFYLPEYNMCIEYDGIQHFEPIDFFGGHESFELTKKHDKIKNDYCKNNGIKLLRIPYFKNIEEELSNFLFI